MPRAILIFALLLLWTAPLLAQVEYDPADYRIRVNATVNLRGGPGTEFEIITTIQAGAELQVVAETDQWFAVVHEGQQAWLANEFDYTRLEPTPTPEPSPTIEPTPTAEPTPTIQQPPPVSITSVMPECTREEFIAIVHSPTWQELFVHWNRVSQAHGSGGSLRADQYLYYRNTVWANLPTCSPLFEYAIWSTVWYAELLLLNFQDNHLPYERADAGVAALHGGYDSHPLIGFHTKLLEAWNRHFPPQEPTDSAADDGAAEETEEE